jgi:hypothetical protein
LGGLQIYFDLSEELIRKLHESQVYFFLANVYDRDRKDIWILGWKSDIDLSLGGIYVVECHNYRNSLNRESIKFTNTYGDAVQWYGEGIKRKNITH